jgi:hypothetical protein
MANLKTVTRDAITLLKVVGENSREENRAKEKGLVSLNTNPIQ